MIWIAMALMTGVAVVSLLWPLTGPAPRAQAESADVAYYRAQIAEIDAETARGEIDGRPSGPVTLGGDRFASGEAARVAEVYPPRTLLAGMAGTPDPPPRRDRRAVRLERRRGKR